MVSIKIGEEEQFPISQLGDGLQQVIILTYSAFLNNQNKNMFFIEEPELHMHAGMLRQLMNFYLNETDHYYFFTTHSNHLLDMADESDEVIIQKFVKETNDKGENQFKIYRCDRDRELLQSLGVKPSSVYLANCTIWVEGITDRLYLVKYMEKYLKELEESNPEKYKAYRRFMPNYHYAFVEYAGANMVHWNFDDDFAENMLDDKGLSAKAIASDMLLIADGDTDKADRIDNLKKELGEEKIYILECKEIENTIPSEAIIWAALGKLGDLILFHESDHEKANPEEAKRFQEMKKQLEKYNEQFNFYDEKHGIGYSLDLISTGSKDLQDFYEKSRKLYFCAGKISLDKNGKVNENIAGTITDKLKFCRKVLKYFDDENHNWQLTESARELCEKIYQHIEGHNDQMIKRDD